MDNFVYEEYSANGEYRFVVTKRRNLYKVWLEKKITDDMDNEFFVYCSVADYMHITDTLERAVEIGKECINCFI